MEGSAQYFLYFRHFVTIGQDLDMRVKGINGFVTKLLQLRLRDKTCVGFGVYSGVLSPPQQKTPPGWVGFLLSCQYVCAHLLSYVPIELQLGPFPQTFRCSAT